MMPPIIHVQKKDLEEMQSVSDEVGARYKVVKSKNQEDIYEIHFTQMTDSMLFELIDRMPIDLFAYRAVISNIIK